MARQKTNIATKSRPAPRPPQRAATVLLERYALTRVLGEGAMGIVYEAEDLQTGELLALKRLDARRLGGVAVSYFRREFDALARLSHPGLCRVHAFGQLDDGSVYYTLELVRGPNLRDATAACREGSPEERAAAFEDLRRRVGELCRTLAYIHDAGLVHNDVKPENILVPPDGRVRLIDFGLASERRRPARGGTLAYCAPERLEGAPGDLRSDLYALGATLYEILTGRPPFVGRNDEVIRGHIGGQPTPPKALDATIPIDLERVALRLLRKAPAARFDTALEVARALGYGDDEPWLGPPIVLDPGFHGRNRELRRALATLAPARRARGPVALVVTGETGIGKSAFARRLAQRAQLRGFSAEAVTALANPTLGAAGLAAVAEGLLAAHRRGPLALVADDLDRLDAGHAWAVSEVLRRAMASERGSRLALILVATDARRLPAPLAELLGEFEARDRASALALGPLGPVSIERMVGSACGIAPTSDELKRKRHVSRLAQCLKTHVGGNPLWVTEALWEWHRAGELVPPRKRKRGRQKNVTPPRIRAADAAVAERLAVAPGLAARDLLAVLTALGGNAPLDLALEAAGAIASVEPAGPARQRGSSPPTAAAVGGAKAQPAGGSVDAAAEAAHALEAAGLIDIAPAPRGGSGLLVRLARGAYREPLAATIGAARITLAHDALRLVLGRQRAPLHRLVPHELAGSQPARAVARAIGASCLLRRAGRHHDAEAMLGTARGLSSTYPPALRAALLEESARVADLAGQPLVARERYQAALAALAAAEGPAVVAAGLRIRLSVAFSLYRTRHVTEARRYAVPVARAARALGRPGYRSASLLCLSMIAAHEGRAGASDALLAAAEASAARYGNGRRGRKVRSRLLHQRGALHDRAQDLDAAFACYRDALGLAARSRDASAVATLLVDLASVASRLGKRHLASTLEQVATRRAQAIDALPVLAHVLLHRGAMAWRYGRPELSRRLFRRASHVFQLTRNSLGEVRSRSSEAASALEIGRLGEALRGFERAADEALAAGRRNLVADARVGLALTATFAGDLDTAKRALEQASELGEEASGLQRAEWHEAMACYLDERGEPGDAVTHGQQAMAARVSLRKSHDAIAAALAQAERLLELRDVSAARGLLVEARALARELRSRRLVVRCELVAGLCAFEEGMAESAVRHLLRGIADLRSDPERGWRLHEALSRAYEALDEDQLARAHRARAQRTLEQLQETLPPEVAERFARRRRVQRLLLERLAEPPAGTSPAADDPLRGVLTETLLTVNRAFVSERDLRRLLDLILDGAIAVTGAERGFLVMRGKKGRMRFKVGRNIAKDDLRKGSHKISHTIAQQVLERGVSVIVEDCTQDDRFSARKSVLELGLASVVCVPLVLRGEVTGVIYLDHRFRLGAFGAPALRAAEALADQAAVALENARLFDENERQRERVERQKRQLEALVERRDIQIVEYQRNLDEASARPFRHRQEEMIGRSRPMVALRAQLDRAAAVAYPVLVLGESGAGKELSAREIHRSSSRRGRPFVAQSCQRVPEPLLEAELFGAAKGAYAGGEHDRVGLIEAADGGTIFVDEVADLSLAVQAKLLRIIEEGEVQPLGALRPRKVDVRVVCATQRDLASEVLQGRFREDLFFRLKVLEIRIPPLRERAEDIAALSERFLSELRGPLAGTRLRLSAEALAALERHEWPGNVRQLKQELLRASTLSATGSIELSHLSSEVRGGPPGGPSVADDIELDAAALDRASIEAERRVLLAALERCKQNRTRCAELLGVSRFGLQKRLKRCGIPLKRGAARRPGAG